MVKSAQVIINRLKQLNTYSINIGYESSEYAYQYFELSPDGEYVKTSDIQKIIKEFEESTNN